jgi:hypothetical protein
VSRFDALPPSAWLRRVNDRFSEVDLAAIQLSVLLAETDRLIQ